MRSPGEALLQIHLGEIPNTTWTPEYQFHSDRKWRFDFAELDLRIAIEVEGGIYSGGRHVKGKGFQADMDKLNEATRLGWRVLRFSTEDVMSGKAKDMVRAVLS
jgi:very-short-patch-repair endonuclease